MECPRTVYLRQTKESLTTSIVCDTLHQGKSTSVCHQCPPLFFIVLSHLVQEYIGEDWTQIGSGLNRNWEDWGELGEFWKGMVQRIEKLDRIEHELSNWEVVHLKCRMDSIGKSSPATLQWIVFWCPMLSSIVTLIHAIVRKQTVSSLDGCQNSFGQHLWLKLYSFETHCRLLSDGAKNATMCFQNRMQCWKSVSFLPLLVTKIIVVYLRAQWVTYCFFLRWKPRVNTFQRVAYSHTAFCYLLNHRLSFN